MEDEDWTTETTVAALLARQLPVLLAMNASDQAGVDPDQADPDQAVQAGEVPVAEPAVRYALTGPGGWVLVNGDWVIPAGVDSGALVARLRYAAPRWAEPIYVERILGPGLDLGWQCDGLPPRFAGFGCTLIGGWLRVPDYQPAMTAEQVAELVEQRLRPVEVKIEAEVEVEGGFFEGQPPGLGPNLLDREQWDITGLLVPTEIGHRLPGRSGSS